MTAVHVPCGTQVISYQRSTAAAVSHYCGTCGRLVRPDESRQQADELPRPARAFTVGDAVRVKGSSEVGTVVYRYADPYSEVGTVVYRYADPYTGDASDEVDVEWDDGSFSVHPMTDLIDELPKVGA